MVVPVRRRLRNKTPPQEESQGQTIQEAVLHLQIPVLQLLMIVQHSRQDFHFDLDMIHQMMEVMEMIQEEVQMMMAMEPQWQISTYKRSDLANHQVIQILGDDGGRGRRGRHQLPHN